jgi:PAS domain S-box-containing protein
MKENEVEILKSALTREKEGRRVAEKILEDKSRNLFLISKELKLTNLKLEQLLEEKSTELQGISENINDAYVVIDLMGNVLKMNSVAEELFGYSIKHEDFNLTILKYEEDSANVFKSFESLLNTGAFTNFTSRIITKNKDIKWVQTNASLIYDKKQNPISAQGIVRDITDLKELEFQKETIRKQLEKSNLELQEYAHVVSHDLKSPLRSIDALVSWIETDNKGKLDENTLQNLELIKSTLDTMDTLISDILEFSGAGVITDEETLVDLDILVNDLKKVLFIPSHISVNILSKLPSVKGDKTKFKQLFQNLISNAVKFIDKEVGVVDIDFEPNEKFYQFSIKDNGLGIEEKYHEKIFKIFQTLNNSKESTGVGLSIVKKVVNLYQGDIWLESTLGIGTKFIFTLKR